MESRRKAKRINNEKRSEINEKKHTKLRNKRKKYYNLQRKKQRERVNSGAKNMRHEEGEMERG